MQKLNSPHIVLDSSALLAFMQMEPGHDVVGPLMDKAVISSVNFAEVVSILVDKLGIPLEKAHGATSKLVVDVPPFTKKQSILCASLRPLTKVYGLSLGDRACLSLGIEMKSPVYTGDRIWGNLKIEGIDVQVIR